MKHVSALQATIVTAVLAFAVTVPAADATIRMNLIGSTACKAASGPGADVFYFDSQFAQNTSTSVQYLTCAIPEINPNSSRPANDIQVLLRNPTVASMTFTCVIQAGYSTTGVNSAVYQVVVAANSEGGIYSSTGSTPALPVRNDLFGPYILSCAVPPQGRVDTITAGYPETIS